MERGARRRRTSGDRSERRMIYCVVPQALKDELLDRLTEYYEDDPNVTVILDRREGQGSRVGRGGRGGEPGAHPADRDRRRRRAKGSFPPIGPTREKS